MKLRYKVLISVLGVSLLSFIGFNIYTSGVKVNGEVVAFKPVEEIVADLEIVKPTSVSIRNKDIDITSAYSRKVPEFEKKYGDQKIEAVLSVDENKIKELVSSNVELGEFEKIDFDTLLKTVKVDKKVTCDECIVLRYSKKVINRYKKLRKWTCRYKEINKTWSAAKYVKITKSGKLKIDYSIIDKIIERVEKKYNTQYRPIRFKTHSGKKIKIQTASSTWYSKIDREQEYQYLKDSLGKGKSVKKRMPVWGNDWGHIMNYREIPSTYVEVSISQQHVWYYKNGRVVMDSPCVTGKDGHSTPVGVYFISEYKPQGKVLRGADYATPVNRWMRLTGNGVGLHDATWRSSFGGTIYHSNGSHGCVNLPFSFADRLCKRVRYGTCVIVHS